MLMSEDLKLRTHLQTGRAGMLCVIKRQLAAILFTTFCKKNVLLKKLHLFLLFDDLHTF